MTQLRIEEETALMDLLREDRERARETQRRIELAAERNDSVLCRELRRQRDDWKGLATFMAVGFGMVNLLWIAVMILDAKGL